MAAKMKKINVNNIEIGISFYNNEDYICLTDMVKNEEGNDHIRNWMRNRNTVEFLGIWEQINNPDFKGVEFDTFRKAAGLNSFNLTPKKWIEATNAIGILSKAGRYGGTYAHKDIAFEFGAWISPVFKLYIIKEYQRLKEAERNEYNLEWDVKRILSKVNYQIHTDAVKNHIIPTSKFKECKEWIIYAEEADLLNMALFECTAKEWRESNPELSLGGKNIRDFASINELTILSNLESLNSELIKNNLDKEKRYLYLKETAKSQLNILDNNDIVKSIKRENKTTYLNKKKNKGNKTDEPE